MGINLLSPLAKGIASVQVSLRHGQGSHVIIDGRFLNHRMSGRGTAARDLIIDDDLTAHVRQCARRVRQFEDLGYRVTVVFDGAVPPAKMASVADLSRQRELARRRARELDSRGVQPEAVNQVAAKACVFDSRMVARIAALLRPRIKGKVLIAPGGEAGAQLVVFQDIYRRIPTTKIVYVYSEDSELIVLGVRSLLWEVSEAAAAGSGALSGNCIHARAIFQPSLRDFARDTDAHAFLRQLHGLPRRYDPALRALPLSEAAARARLIVYAAVVGNDYAAFENVNPVAAAKIALKPIQGSARDAAAPPFGFLVRGIARSLVELSQEEVTPRHLRRAEEKLRTCNNMFRNAVVWDPAAGGILRHLSGDATSEDITKDTGTLALSSKASRIAAGELCAGTGREWVPPLTEIPQGQQRHGTLARQSISQKRGSPGSFPPSPLPPSHAKIPKRAPQDVNKINAVREVKVQKRAPGGPTPASLYSQAKIPKRAPTETNNNGFAFSGGQGTGASRGSLGPSPSLPAAAHAKIPKRVPPGTNKFSGGGQSNNQKWASPAPPPPSLLPAHAKIPRRLPHDINKRGSSVGAERVIQKRAPAGSLVPARSSADHRKTPQPDISEADDRPKNGINRLPYEGEDINAWIASRNPQAATRRRSFGSDGNSPADRDLASSPSPWSSLGKTQRSVDSKTDFVVWGQGSSQKKASSVSLAPARSPRHPQPESFVADKYPRYGNHRPYGGEDITKWIGARGSPVAVAPVVQQPSRCLASSCGRIVERDVSFCSDECMVVAQKQAARALLAVQQRQHQAAGAGANPDAKSTGISVPRKGKKSSGALEGGAADTTLTAAIVMDSAESTEGKKASAGRPPGSITADEERFSKGLEAVRSARSEQGQKFRHKIMDIFRDLFSEGMAELGVDTAYAAVHCGVLAWDLEHELNAFFQANREGYREKAQSLRFNIKFAKNPELFKDLLAGITSMRTLCGMSIDELASSHLREERQRIRDESYAGHLRQDEDASEIVYKDGALQRIANIKSDAEKQVDVLPGVDFDIEKGGRRGDAGNNVSDGGGNSRSSSSSSSSSSSR